MTEGNIMRILQNKKKCSIIAMSFSPDGKYLAFAFGDYSLRVWNLVTDKCRILARWKKVPFTSVEFTPDSKYVIARPYYRGLLAWSIDNQEQPKTIIENSSNAYSGSIALAPQLGLFAANSWPSVNTHHTVRAWDFNTWEETVLCQLPAQWHQNSFSFDPTNKYLITNHGVLDVNTKSPVLNGHFPGNSLRWVPNTSLVVICNCPGQIFVSNTTDGAHVKYVDTCQDRNSDFDVSPDGRYLVVAGTDECVRLVDTSTWQVKFTYNWKIGKLRSIKFDKAGERVACGSFDGTILIWDWDL